MSKDAALKPEVVALSKSLATAIKDSGYDQNTHKAVVSKDWYANNLPEGITIETVKTLHAHNRNVLAATHHASGVSGIDHLKKHKDLEKVSVVVPVTGNDKFEASTKRSSTSRNPTNGEEIVSYGSTAVKLALYGSGELKKSKVLVSEHGAKHLAD